MGLFELFKSENSDSTTLEDKLLKLAKTSVADMESSYMKLSQEGKFEVMLFSSSIALWLYHSRNLRTKVNNSKYAMELVKQARLYNIQKSEDDHLRFIIDRLGFYANQYNNLLEPNSIPGKLYSNFYISPLKKDPDNHHDLTEILNFKLALNYTIRFIKEDVKKI
tara:strand:+ start:1649 stop:2143 length:495 start_codon:yes stop_codon:yes gene_type:complete